MIPVSQVQHSLMFKDAASKGEDWQVPRRHDERNWKPIAYR